MQPFAGRVQSNMPKRYREQPSPTPREQMQNIWMRQRDLTFNIRMLKQKAEREERRQNGAALSVKFRNILVALMFLANNYETDMALSYWQDARRRRHLPQLEDDEMHERLRNLFMECDLDKMTEWGWGTTAPIKCDNPFWRAWRWKVKMDLQRWVRQVNMRQGLAPSSCMVARHWNALATHPIFNVQCVEDPRTSTTSRTRLFKWRKQVGARWKAIRVTERITLEEKRSKAGRDQKKYKK